MLALAYALIAILGAIFLPPDPAMPLSHRLLGWALWGPILLWVLIKGGLDWWECEVAWRLRGYLSR